VKRELKDSLKKKRDLTRNLNQIKDEIESNDSRLRSQFGVWNKELKREKKAWLKLKKKLGLVGKRKIKDCGPHGEALKSKHGFKVTWKKGKWSFKITRRRKKIVKKPRMDL